jgi:hypothetical protein
LNKAFIDRKPRWIGIHRAHATPGCNRSLAVLTLCILGCMFGLGACAVGPSRIAPFRARPDAAEPGKLTGPFTGVVVDATTLLPISGALVYATWTLESGNGFAIAAASKEAVAATDSSGRYQIAAIAVPRGMRLTEANVLVYKRGFVAYRSDRRFSDGGPRFDFAQRENQVTLQRWREDYSHIRHVRFVGSGTAVAALTQWELADASDEMTARFSPGKPIRGNGGPVVVAAQLLTQQDVKNVTKYDATFETGPLQDEPDTSVYSSQHFKAVARPETWDVAVRLWQLPAGKAVEQYDSLLGLTATPVQKDDIGSKSFITTVDQIRAVGFMDVPRGAVVMLTCGTSQCVTEDQAIALTRLVYDRVKQLVPVVQGPAAKLPNASDKESQ